MKWIMVLLVLVMCGCSDDVEVKTKPVPKPADTKFVGSDSFTVKMTHGDGEFLVVNGAHNDDLMLHCIGAFEEVKCNDADTTSDCTEHHLGEDWCHSFKPGEMIQLERWHTNSDDRYVYHSTTSRNESDYEVQ